MHSLSLDESQSLFSCPWGNTAQPTDRCYQSISTSGQNGCGLNVLLHKSGLDLRRLSAFFCTTAITSPCFEHGVLSVPSDDNFRQQIWHFSQPGFLKYIQYNNFTCIHLNQLNKQTTFTVLGMTLNQVISCHVLLKDVLKKCLVLKITCHLKGQLLYVLTRI